MSLFSDAIVLDTRANQPAANTVVVGTIYSVSDEGNIQERSNGTIWEPFSPTGTGSGDVTHTGALTASAVVVGNGTDDIKVLASLGTTTTVLHGNAAGLPTFGAVVEADITLADNTTNNVSTTKHGLAPKAPNDATQYLDGTGAYSVPAGSGSGGGSVGILGTVVAPVNGDFAWVNQNGASVTAVGNGIALAGVAAGAGDWEWALRVKSAPATPYTITAYIVPSPFSENFRFDGLIFRASGDGKFSAFGNAWNTFASTRMLQVTNYSSVTAQNSALSSNNWQFQPMPYWLQISDDGSDRFYRISSNGVTWLQIYTEGRTTYFTADQVGFGINRRVGGMASIGLVSWEET